MTAPVSPSAWRLVPVEPTEAMLQGACDKHTPGQPMSKHRGDECPRFATRRRIYAKMLAASPAPSMEGLREKVARIIDPSSAPNSKGQTAAMRERWERALAKADQCLTLLAREGE